MWRIAAGRQGRFINDFLAQGRVSMGWHALGDFTRFPTKEAMLSHAKQVFPEWTPRRLQVSVGQCWRFVHTLAPGDHVTSYHPGQRIYHFGTIVSEARFDPAASEEEFEVYRLVEWAGERDRDDLSQATRNSLGAIQTIIRVPEAAARELLGNTSNSIAPVTDESLLPADDEPAVDPYAELFEQAAQRVQDMILQLDPWQIQDLVAALLRALGYRTLVSPTGADRGKDIIASKDGFGFERPRIVVEVKHRREKMGAPDIRAFIGGRHSDDRGLYVSTGGFSQEALYEAERSNTVTHLMDLDALSRAILDNYEAFDDTGRSLLPLRRLYWPSNG